MRLRSIGVLTLLCALFTPIGANRASAQSSEKPVRYTYVSEWGVPRAMWGDYLKGEAADNELMKKALADGVIIGYGSFAILNHGEAGWTHGTWFDANSMANLLKFLEILRNAPDATAAPLAAAKHADFILQSHDYGGHSGTFTNAILRVGRWAPRPGVNDADGKILKATVVPLLDKLVADGALHSYTIHTEELHTLPIGTFYIAILANGPEGIDKFDSALDAARKTNPAEWAGFQATIDESGHYDFLARVGVMANK